MSGAAARAGVTQSAMSRSLARLRDALDDELLVQVGRGMETTAFARTLLAPLRSILREIDAQILSPQTFCPADSERDFSIAAVDFAESLVLGPWISGLGAVAPGISINLTGTQEAFRGGLSRGELDLVLGVVSGNRASLKSRRLLTDSYVTVVRQGHPLAKKRSLEVDDYPQYRHVLVSPSGRGVGHVDAALEKLGKMRHVAVRVSSFLIALQFVVNSDLVITVPRSVARQFEYSSNPVVFLQTGLELPELVLSMLWHSTRDGDAGHRWLREQIVEQAQRVQAESADSIASSFNDDSEAYQP